MLRGILLINLLSRTFAVLAKDFADETTGLEMNLQNETCLKTDVLSEARSRVDFEKGKASEKNEFLSMTRSGVQQHLRWGWRATACPKRW